MRLDASESYTNSGTLRVDVLDAADLPAADRNGYSDPYCKFVLNGKDIFKTKTQKKTLHPAWNEFFETQVRSRTAAKFDVNIYDWDFGDKADFLGSAAINLEILEPFLAQEVTLGLDGKSGAIRLRMLFKPDYVTRSRQGSSTFHGTFATPGKVIGAPVKGVGKGAVLVGGGVAKGASFLGKSFRRRKSMHGQEEEAPTNGHSAPIQVDGQEKTSSPHSRQKSAGAHSISSQTGHAPGGADMGTASISIVSASDFPPSTNVRVLLRVEGGKAPKEVHKTKAQKLSGKEVTWAENSESVKVPCAADTQFKLIVKDHSTFGSDDDVGEGVFFIDDQGSGGEKVVKVGSGKVVIRSSFTPTESDNGSIGASPGKLRRGILGGTKRESRDFRERSVTPQAQ